MTTATATTGKKQAIPRPQPLEVMADIDAKSERALSDALSTYGNTPHHHPYRLWRVSGGGNCPPILTYTFLLAFLP